MEDGGPALTAAAGNARLLRACGSTAGACHVRGLRSCGAPYSSVLPAK